MRIARLIVAIVTGLLLFSTSVCGLWIRYSGQADSSNLNFHLVIGLATTLAGIATAILIALSR